MDKRGAVSDSGRLQKEKTLSKLADLSVVIPTLNAAPSLPRTLEAFEEWRNRGAFGEVLVVDAGSSDGGANIAAQWGARVLEGPRGRGAQLAEGAKAAKGRWLLFLHADTQLEKGWLDAVETFMERAEAGASVDGRAAVFRFALDDPDPRARRIEALARWRGRRIGLPYGDQGLLISRRLYDAVGGYRNLTLMEDVDLVRRLGRARLEELAIEAVTSAARYRRNGWVLRPLRNMTILLLYFAGIPEGVLKRLYG